MVFLSKLVSDVSNELVEINVFNGFMLAKVTLKLSSGNCEIWSAICFFNHRKVFGYWNWSMFEFHKWWKLIIDQVYCHRKSFCCTTALGLTVWTKYLKFHTTPNGTSWSICHIPQTRRPPIFIYFHLWNCGLMKWGFIMFMNSTKGSSVTWKFGWQLFC